MSCAAPGRAMRRRRALAGTALRCLELYRNLYRNLRVTARSAAGAGARRHPRGRPEPRRPLAGDLTRGSAAVARGCPCLMHVDILMHESLPMHARAFPQFLDLTGLQEDSREWYLLHLCASVSHSCTQASSGAWVYGCVHNCQSFLYQYLPVSPCCMESCSTCVRLSATCAQAPLPVHGCIVI